MCDLPPLLQQSSNGPSSSSDQLLNSSTGSSRHNTTAEEGSSDGDSDVDVTTVGDDSKFSFLPGFNPSSSSNSRQKRSSTLSDYLRLDKAKEAEKHQQNLKQRVSSHGFTIDEIMRR